MFAILAENQYVNIHLPQCPVGNPDGRNQMHVRIAILRDKNKESRGNEISTMHRHS